MEIRFKRNYGNFLIIEADNVVIEEDIEERIYFKTEEGKIDFSIKPERDIKADYIDMFVRTLDDMIYYRKAEYDSSNLIENLFEKLDSNLATTLSKKLFEKYKPEEE